MANDMFLKLAGIKGEAQDAKHKGEIDVLSLSWGAVQIGSHAGGGGGGTGKVSVHDIHFTKHVDSSSSTLFYDCTSGKHIPDGLFTIRKAGEKPLEYLKIKLADILVSSYSTGGSQSGNEKVTESISLNFSKFHVEYQIQKPDGSGAPGGEVGWDVKQNAPW